MLSNSFPCKCLPTLSATEADSASLMMSRKVLCRYRIFAKLTLFLRILSLFRRCQLLCTLYFVSGKTFFLFSSWKDLSFWARNLISIKSLKFRQSDTWVPATVRIQLPNCNNFSGSGIFDSLADIEWVDIVWTRKHPVATWVLFNEFPVRVLPKLFEPPARWPHGHD